MQVLFGSTLTPWQMNMAVVLINATSFCNFAGPFRIHFKKYLFFFSNCSSKSHRCHSSHLIFNIKRNILKSKHLIQPGTKILTRLMRRLILEKILFITTKGTPTYSQYSSLALVMRDEDLAMRHPSVNLSTPSSEASFSTS